MCTVVTRLEGGTRRILALRDELTSRDFDDPAEWWPSQPGVVGGRDRTAGGTWCATDVASGTTALVLNRPERRLAAAGAASRGVLPLLALQHGVSWPDHVELPGMASFTLVLAGPDALRSWTFDGEALAAADHDAGLHMFTSGGVEDGKAERYFASFDVAEWPDGWRSLLLRDEPADDRAELIVRHEHEGRVFATVFGQLIDARPRHVDMTFSRQPWVVDSWRHARAPER